MKLTKEEKAKAIKAIKARLKRDTYQIPDMWILWESVKLYQRDGTEWRVPSNGY